MYETCLIIIHDPGMRPGPEVKGVKIGVSKLVEALNVYKEYVSQLCSPCILESCVMVYS